MERLGRGVSEDEVGAFVAGVLDMFGEEVPKGFGDDGWTGALFALGLNFALVLIPASLHVDPAPLEVDIADL